MTDETDTRIRIAIQAQRELGMKGDSWDNFAVARGILHSELGYDGGHRPSYSIDEGTRNILLAHARQDAAHALSNTTALLGRVQHLTHLVYALVILLLLLGAGLAFGALRIGVYY